MDLELGAYLRQHFSFPVDVVVMQKNSPLFLHAVVNKKMVIYEKGLTKNAFMEVRSFREYLDGVHFQRKRLMGKKLKGRPSGNSTVAD